MGRKRSDENIFENEGLGRSPCLAVDDDDWEDEDDDWEDDYDYDDDDDDDDDDCY